MNPEAPKPQFTPERAPVNLDQHAEYGQQLSNPERGVEQGREREQNMQTVDRAPALPMPPTTTVAMPQPQTQVVAMPVAQPQGDDNPAMAADDDLIEKEWVDKAKNIIVQTRDDPYRREREVSRLQADYLRKRYGREIGEST